MQPIGREDRVLSSKYSYLMSPWILHENYILNDKLLESVLVCWQIVIL